MTIYEGIATLLNLGFVVLIIRNRRIGWILGFLGSLLSLQVFVVSKLYSDSLLQLFYMGMAIYGWLQWGKKDNDSNGFRSLNDWKYHTAFVILGGLATLVLGGFWATNTDAALPYWDAGTTVFSLGATYLQAKKYLSNWLYWVIIDIICAGIYFHKGLYAFTVLFLIYTAMAIKGFMTWRKLDNDSKISLQ